MAESVNRKQHRIVLTGGPASGKSETLAYLKTQDSLSGFSFLDELARQLLKSNPELRENWHQFHLEIYRRQIARESELGSRSFVTDRGTVDTFAFHPETTQAVNTTLEAEYQRYTLVILLGSTASLGQNHYVTDSIRDESIEQALAIERACRQVWQNHPHYHFFEAETDKNIKRTRIMNLLESYLSDE